MIKELQRNVAFMDPTRAAAHLVGAQAGAMQAAAANANAGPAMAFMGMGMAGQVGGMNAQSLFQMGQQQAPQQQMPPQQQAPQQQMPPQQQTPQQQSDPAGGGWKCSCGATATGKFCPECGKSQTCGQHGMDLLLRNVE